MIISTISSNLIGRSSTINVRDYFLLLRKRWHDDFPEKSSLNFFELTGLLLLYEHEDRLKFVVIKRVLKIAQIYHVTITRKNISIGILIQIIELLSDLQTLTIESLSLDQSKPFSFKELRQFSRTNNTGKMTEVSVQQLNSINEIDFLMALCPAMIYFRIDHMKNMPIAFCVCPILKRIEHHDHRSPHFSQIKTISRSLLEEKTKKSRNKFLTVEFVIS